MMTSQKPAELIRRWKAMRACLMRESSEIGAKSNWRHLHQAKVLSFLIQRYEEDLLGSRPGCQPIARSTVPRNRRSAPPVTNCVSPEANRMPRVMPAIGPKLKAIQTANVSSYADFGLGEVLK